jgi:hypothetical protein
MDSPLSLLPDGPFTVAMAREVGIGRRALRGLVEGEDVRRVLRGVYVRQSTPDSLALRARAACLVVSPAAVLCDRTAAWLHGIDVFWSAEHDYPSRLETFVLRGSTRLTRAETYGGQRELDPGDVMEIGGTRVTTPLRTALDLGCALPRRDALAALDSFMRVFGITKQQLKREVPRYFRRRGVRQLRNMIELADPASESPGESWTRLEILDSNLPAPQVQWWITRNGRQLYRLDLAYPGMKICVEYDGQEFHDSPEAREADEARRAWLRERGWIVIVVTKDDLTPDGVRRWTEELRRAVEARRVRIRLRPGRRTPQRF